jgi:hypothetical protein
MQLATRIEPRSARWTSRLAIQVLKDGQLSAARAAQNRLLIEFSLRPSPGRMTVFQFVTVEAGIIRPAAVEFDRNDIEFAPVVRTPGSRIYLDPSDRNSRNRELQVNYPKPQRLERRLSALRGDSPVRKCFPYGRECDLRLGSRIERQGALRPACSEPGVAVAESPGEDRLYRAVGKDMAEIASVHSRDDAISVSDRAAQISVVNVKFCDVNLQA